MKKNLSSLVLFFAFFLVFLNVASLTSFGEEKNEPAFLAETILRDKNGNLVLYLQSERFKVEQDILDKVINQTLDHSDDHWWDSSQTYQNGEKYQILKKTTFAEMEKEDFRAWDAVLFRDEDSYYYDFMTFYHDGYPIIPGDVQEIIWTIRIPL